MRMSAKLLALVMWSSFFNPSFAFSSHFDPDGAPLSELSWSSSLAVVAVSFSGLFTFIFLMLACLCCKKGNIGFKEFENAEGDDYTTEFSVQGSPATQNGPEVYILPLTEVSLPMAKQPGRSVQLLKSTDLGRYSLLYLKEIGHGWFGKVFLGEVNSGISSTQVVVKELKVSASVQDQMQFLEEAQPYRALQHSNLLQCLAQCAEVTPYLLVMEFCPLGDLKGYLRSCRVAESMVPDPLTLQRMACELACGVLHLHKNNYVHSDLALRNCLLTADLTVKIGDYGLSHCKYKDDYFVTADQLWVPLRWIAPELIDEVHSNLLVVDQTKASNVWSLGVTIWELFELGAQPYHHYSDRQVLTYAIKEQQLKLPKPQLKLSLSDRWYEVMQFCWLQPEQRPTAEEVHLLLSYLCAKGTTEAEEDFEKRWKSLKPSGTGGAGHLGSVAELSSSFPLLEQFSGDGFHSDGDDILTVMETSHGLNFEYKWEPNRAEAFQTPAGTLSPRHAAHYQDLYYPASSSTSHLSLGVSPSCYECPPPGVVPILSAHSPSVSSEYYIRIEEPADCDLDFTMCSSSPEGQQASPEVATPWCDKEGPVGGTYDSDSSPTVSLTMEPLLGQGPSGEGPWDHPDYYSHMSCSKDSLCYQPSPVGDSRTEDTLLGDCREGASKDWGFPGFGQAFFEDPLGVSPSGNAAPQDSPGGAQEATVGESTKQEAQGSPPESVTIELGEPESLPCGGSHQEGAEEASLAAQQRHWTSNVSANNNINSGCPPDSWAAHFIDSYSESGERPGTEADPCEPPALDCVPAPPLPEGQASEVASPGQEPGSPPSFASHCQVEEGPAPVTASPSPMRDMDAADRRAVDPGADQKAPEEAMAPCSSPARSPLPSPPQGRALLLSRAAGSLAPVPKPDSPVPWDCSQSNSNEPDQTLDSSGSFPELEGPGSEDEDTTEATSGVFTDFSNDCLIEKPDTTPAFRSLQKQVGTPDSLESLDIPSTASDGGEIYSPTVSYPATGQPRALDSGYDTENYESPEFVLKEPHEPRDPEEFGPLGKEDESPALEMRLSSSISAELHGLNEKNPYRDSAYFSDYDTETERPSQGREEEEDDSEPGDTESSPLGPQPHSGDTPTPEEAGAQPAPAPAGEPPPGSIGGGDQESPEALGEGLAPAAVPAPAPLPTPAPVPSKLFFLTPVLPSLEGSGAAQSCCEPQEAPGLSPTLAGQGTWDPVPGAEAQEWKEATACESQPGEKPAPRPTPLRLDLSDLPAAKESRPAEEEEEEDSDDSDESDEELCCYNIQEQSEESEEEPAAVPIVVAESHSARNLRSLLKMPSLMSQSFCEDLDRKKKAVSFFDDVTVYLFDQESPTRELGEQHFPETKEVASSFLPSSPTSLSPSDQLSTADNFSDRTVSEESGGFEWDDDFPLMPAKKSFVSSPGPGVPDSVLPSLATPPKQVLPVQFSRFTVSPSPVSRFSITHVSDSDIESVGGSSEDGDRE
ncbi:serine/threonine-protein kinase LMTK1 isoform X6 [Antechinus flavipes]|uniref:serine/threonine-protein kinase LMTK1 isoform X6 n=1 Tax=Antechinus flavipes TaxID=38775 RepID=UPI002235B117|nr:serine/threonine-protein kinase LMTK1 isoform X6 [Antechinus flavipes]